MELKIKRLSTNRFKINGIVYKRIKSNLRCNGCSFFTYKCLLEGDYYCIQSKNGKKTYYHLIPNEL